MRDPRLPEAVLKAASGESPLTAWWVPCVALVPAVLVTALAVRRTRGRRRTGAERAGWGVLSVLAWLVAAALAVNSYYDAVPDLDGLQREMDALIGAPVSYRTLGGGHVREERVPAASGLHVPASDVFVYTPPGYDPSGATRYPTVYLLHGYPGTAADWFSLGHADLVLDELIRTHTLPPMIVVTPDVNGGGVRDSECLDAADGPKVESWLYSTLVPWVDGHLPTAADPQHRVLGGMSMGGFCAVDQGLRHPETWGAIMGFEAYGDPGRQAATSMGLDDKKFQERSPSHYLPTIPLPRQVPVFLDSGDAAGRQRIRTLAPLLQARGLSVGTRTEGGLGHTWAQARQGLPYGLVFVVPKLGW